MFFFSNKFTSSLQMLFQAPLTDTLPAPYADEIKGWSKATGIELGTIYN